MFLEKAAELTTERVERAKRSVPAALLREKCERCAPSPSFRDAVRRMPGGAIGVIAEVKRSSPSRGPINPGLVLTELVGSYERGGACAISVLTEPEFFGGSLDDLTAARAVTGLPILRKDLIIDTYQLLESRAAGASAVLLIAALLGDGELAHLLGEAKRLGLEALIEVRDSGELDAALGAGAGIIGINNRDLVTLSVDLDTTRRLAPLVPRTMTLVSESGYSRREQVQRLPALGVDAVLVGEALAGHTEPERAIRELGGEGHVTA